MKSKKLSISLIIVITALSLLFGCYYNNYMLPDKGLNSLLPVYLYSISFLALNVILGGLLSIIYKNFLKSLKKPLVSSVYLFIAAIILFLIRYTFIGSNFRKGLVIIYILPVVLLRLYECMKSGSGFLYATGYFLYIIVLSWFSGGEKAALFLGLLFIASEIAAEEIFEPLNKRQWLIHSVILLVVLIIGLIVLVESNIDVYYKRLVGFVSPSAVPEYNCLRAWLHKTDWFSFNPNNTFIDDINSKYACTYAHIATVFGKFMVFSIIIIHFTAAALICRNSLRLKSSAAKYMGVVMALALSLHIVITAGSSFDLMPMIQYGAPFLTSNGLAYSLVPVMMYLFLEVKECDNLFQV